MKRVLLSLLVAASTVAWADTTVSFHGPADEVSHKVTVNTGSVMKFGTEGVTMAELLVPYGQLSRITFQGNVGIGQNKVADASIRITPNPVADQMTVTGVDGADLVIYNAAGAIVSGRRAYRGEAINVAGLAPGLYVVTVNDQSLKFVKK